MLIMNKAMNRHIAEIVSIFYRYLFFLHNNTNAPVVGI